MEALLNDLAARLGLADDPRIVYSLAAASLLFLVSLVSGWSRLDLAALFRPATLLRLGVGVALAFGLVAAAQVGAFGSGVGYSLALGAARLPLYALALAYGPTAGLLAGTLFAAATAVGPYPGWAEALLVLELTVLGWLAISPSPRKRRFAGPLNAVLAHALALATGGVAFAVWRDGELSLPALLSPGVTPLAGLVLAWALLSVLTPGFYGRHLPGSRIGPRSPRQRGTAEDAESLIAVRPQVAASRQLTSTLESRPLEKRPRGRRSLVEPSMHSDNPNG